jgi:hypothetical protein
MNWRWLFIPVILMTSVFLPTLLLPLLLTFTLIFIRESAAIPCIEAPRSAASNHRIVLGERSPPAF